MEKIVQFRQDSEMPATDLVNLETYADEALAHVVADVVSSGLHVSGGQVSQVSATEVGLPALRFYNAGLVYAAAAVPALSLFAYLPAVAKRIVSIVLWGQIADQDVEARDFLIDLTTGATEPRSVAMTSAKVCNVNTLPGAESADPQPPVLQVGYLEIARVVLNPNGIERIDNLPGAQVYNLADHEARLDVVETWKGQAEPRIASIATDLSALAKKTDMLASKSQLTGLAADVARLKEQVHLPTGYASYDADYFGDADKSDPAGAGYAARLEGAGLLFPFAAQAAAALALLNPYDATVRQGADGLVLPAYDSAVRIKTEGYAGDLPLSQYQTQALTVQKYTYAPWAYRYGRHWLYYLPWYSMQFWRYNDAGQQWDLPWPGYWRRYPEAAYQIETATTAVNGVLVGQTVLVANAMWLTQVGLYFTQVAAAGDLHVIVCETDGGKPVLTQAVAHVTVPVASLVKYPAETTIPVPPTLLQAGKRYAIVIITQGDHRAAIVSGNSYTQGTLFFGTDGDYFTGDLTKDLMFSLYGAQFRQARTEVSLAPVSLAGGLTDLALSASQVVPQGTELRYEIQVAGRWYALGDASMVLTMAPDLVPLRAVLLGTSDLAPGFVLAAGALTSSRAAGAMVHWSTARVLGAASTQIQVQVVAAGYDAAHHTIACSLKSGATTYPADTTVSAPEVDGGATRFTFTFDIVGGISGYSIEISGTCDGLVAPFAVAERVDVAM